MLSQKGVDMVGEICMVLRLRLSTRGQCLLTNQHNNAWYSVEIQGTERHGTALIKALHYTMLHYTVLYCTELHFTSLHFTTALHWDVMFFPTHHDVLLISFRASPHTFNINLIIDPEKFFKTKFFVLPNALFFHSIWPLWCLLLTSSADQPFPTSQQRGPCREKLIEGWNFGSIAFWSPKSLMEDKPLFSTWRLFRWIKRWWQNVMPVIFCTAMYFKASYFTVQWTQLCSTLPHMVPVTPPPLLPTWLMKSLAF